MTTETTSSIGAASVHPLVGPAVTAAPAAEEARGPLLRVTGSSGVLDVWLGNSASASSLEADVRDVSAAGVRGLSALAVALGDVARRHRLEVRVIPRIDADGSRILVLFGPRTTRVK